jgi:hypothetical protein
MIPVIPLNDDQLQVTVPAMTRIRQYRSILQETVSCTEPFVSYICKLHKVNPADYVLSEDGRNLIHRSQFGTNAPAPEGNTPLESATTAPDENPAVPNAEDLRATRKGKKSA